MNREKWKDEVVKLAGEPVGGTYPEIGVAITVPFSEDLTVDIQIYYERPSWWENDVDGLYYGADWTEKINSDGEVFEREHGNCIGYVELWLPRMGAGYVAHELCHALLNLMSVKGWDANSGNDEEICYALSNAITYFWNFYYDWFGWKIP